MKLYFPAVLAAIAIALTGCGGDVKQASFAATKPASTAPARAKVPDVVGKTFLEAKSELGKVNYYASIYGPDGVKWASETVPDETVLTVSTAPAAGGVSANATVDVKVNVTEKEFLAGAKSKAAAQEIADAEARIATRYDYFCNSKSYEGYKAVWASTEYKLGEACSIKIMGIPTSSQDDLLPSEQKLVDAVAAKGVPIKHAGTTLGRVMNLCAKPGSSYLDKPTTPESKAEAAVALTVCPDAPHAAALQEGSTVSKIADGSMVVGEAMEAGTWKTKPGVKLCYWSRNSGGGAIIDNDIIDFAPDGVIVTVYAGEGFKSSNCGTWTKIG